MAAPGVPADLDGRGDLDGATKPNDAAGLDSAARLDGDGELDSAAGLDDAARLDGGADLHSAAGLDDAAELDGDAELDSAEGLDDAAEIDGAAELDSATGLDSAAGLDGAAHVRVDSLPGVLAIIPYLLGFHPADSLVILGISARGQIKVTFRYDLPNPPSEEAADQIASHATDVLSAQETGGAVVVGYGTGTLVTPVVEACGAALSDAGITLRDLIRVEDSRYWSYLCDDPRCCPADGVLFDPQVHPAAAELTTAGMPAYPDRATLSQSLGPVRGEAATAMLRATERALGRAREMQAKAMRLFVSEGRHAARAAIGIYRAGGQITDDDQIAWLAVTLADLRVRDDAWARMDPAFRQAHQRLWTDVMRRACQPYVPAPAALLAFTAWQSGDGAIANIALERALDADPCYSLALLLSEALESGLPPSLAQPPMTPEEVAASYRDTDAGH